jgi:hypothetical protein
MDYILTFTPFHRDIGGSFSSIDDFIQYFDPIIHLCIRLSSEHIWWSIIGEDLEAVLASLRVLK